MTSLSPISLDPPMNAAIEAHISADKRLGALIPKMICGSEDAVRESLLVIAQAHIQSALSLMKAAGLSPQEIAEEFGYTKQYT